MLLSATIYGAVFPARAGMSRSPRQPMMMFACVPRASGDEPRLTLIYAVDSECSPRERG